jgi:TrmH family RNA methyltransferase
MLFCVCAHPYPKGETSVELITSRKNPLLVQIRKLVASRAARRESGLFVGEGPKLLEEALRHGAAVTAVVTEQGVSAPCQAGARQIEVPADVLQSLSDTQAPQGVLFLCRMPDTAPPERLEGGRYLVLDGLQDPGNVGTIWRTADALGADGVILVHRCADPWSPKTVRATMGACFRLPVWECEPEELARLMAASHIPLYATALRADTIDVRKADLNRAAVVIGSEGRGISDVLLNMSRQAVKIPMRERCESLNAAAAATVVLWEMARQN